MISPMTAPETREPPMRERITLYLIIVALFLAAWLGKFLSPLFTDYRS
jgi:hypothetical protein